MMRVFSSTIALATRATASCAVRFGRYPYDPSWKSASKIGSRMSFNAPWTTRSRIAGIERTRTFLPPSFGISFFPWLHGPIRVGDQFIPNLHEKTFRSAFPDGSERDTVNTRCPIVASRHLVGFPQGLHLADVDV